MKEKTPIFRIFTDAGPEVGYGHLTRCTALYQAFRAKTDQVEIVVEQSAWGDEPLTGRGNEPDLKSMNWRTDPWILAEQPITVTAIFDSFSINQDMVDWISGLPFRQAFIDDWNRLDYTGGVVIDYTILADRDPRYAGSADDGRVRYLLGSRYIALREAFRDVPETPLRSDMTSLMVTFGGSDVRNLTSPVMARLERDFPGLEKHVIIGGGFRNTDALSGLSGHNVRVHRTPDAEGMKRIMLQVDVAVSAGGQTLNELARVGVPTVAVAVVDNTEHNIRGWQETGFIDYAGLWDDPGTIERISRAIDSMKDIEVRRRRSRAGRRAVDGAGTRRIRDVLMELFE